MKKPEKPIEKKEKTAEKPHKTILARPQKRPHPKEAKEVEPPKPSILKEKSQNLPNAKEKAEALIGNGEERHPLTTTVKKKGAVKLKKSKKAKKTDENQQEQELQVEPLKPVNEKPRKKAAKKKKKKKKATVNSKAPEVMRSFEFPSQEATISKLLMKSLEEFKSRLFFFFFFSKAFFLKLKAKKIQNLSSKKQKTIQIQEKFKNLNQRNTEIRRSNLERFLKRQEIDPFQSRSFKPPWGLDQQRFKRYYLSRFLKEFELNPEFQEQANQSKGPVPRQPREEM